MCNLTEKIIYILPLLPIATRSILIYCHREHMGDHLSREERAVEAHRGYYQSMLGFTFTALFAVMVLDVPNLEKIQTTLYFLMASFVGYIAAINWQSYKFKRWHDLLATSFSELASLSLILSIVSIVYVKNIFEPSIKYLLIVSCLLVWLADHSLRMVFQWQHLSAKRKENKNAKEA